MRLAGWHAPEQGLSLRWRCRYIDLDRRHGRHRRAAVSEAYDASAQFSCKRVAALDLVLSFLAQPGRARKLGSLSSIAWSNHGVVIGEAPLFPVLLRSEAVLCQQVAPQGLELFTIL